jgi:hypothetical protein
MALAGLWERGKLEGRTAATVVEESICECGRDVAVVEAIRALTGGD